MYAVKTIPVIVDASDDRDETERLQDCQTGGAQVRWSHQADVDKLFIT